MTGDSPVVRRAIAFPGVGGGGLSVRDGAVWQATAAILGVLRLLHVKQPVLVLLLRKS